MTDFPDKMEIPNWEFRVVIGRTRIDYDPNKDERNRKDHGYLLESAVEQLERMLLPLGGSPPKMTSDGFWEEDEVRHMHMGVDDCGRVIFFVTTMRDPEIVRLISYRAASREEREQFFKHTGFRQEE